jgi:hypothetical protein
VDVGWRRPEEREAGGQVYQVLLRVFTVRAGTPTVNGTAKTRLNFLDSMPSLTTTLPRVEPIVPTLRGQAFNQSCLAVRAQVRRIPRRPISHATPLHALLKARKHDNPLPQLG